MEKAETLHFSATIIVCDTEMQSNWTTVTAKGKGHLVTLAKGHFGWNVLKDLFFLEPTTLIRIIFHMKLFGDGRMTL